MRKLLFIVLLCVTLLPCGAQPSNSVKRVLFVLTSHGALGSTGKPTGFYLSEVTHPYEILSEAGIAVDFVSPLGGRPPVDGLKLEDSINHAYWDDPEFQRKLSTTRRPQDVSAQSYDAIFYAGGHGTMWDFPDNEALAGLTSRIYANGGIVAAVCHGPAGLLNVKAPDGTYLIAGREVTGFSNEEEAAKNLTEVLPFLLQERMAEKGALYTSAPKFQEHCVVSGRLITGQNPASASAVGRALVEMLTRGL